MMKTAITQQMTELFDKKMDRADFLKYVGVGLIAMTGLGSLLRIVNPPQKQTNNNGYGSSPYGGSVGRYQD